MSKELYELWRPFVPPSLRRGLFAPSDKESEHVELDKHKDVHAWVKKHFRRFRPEGPKKVLPEWVFDSLVKMYGSLIRRGAVCNLEAELDTRIRDFIRDVVMAGFRNHACATQWSDDNLTLVVAAPCEDSKKFGELFSDCRNMEETLRLHGFYGIYTKYAKPNDDGVSHFILNLTKLTVDVRSVAVWLLLHDYRKSPILWDGDVWVPEEVPDNADSPIEYLL